MKKSLFYFLNDPLYKLMLDLCSESFNESKEQTCLRIKSISLDQLFAICHEHELDGVVGHKIISLGLLLTPDWEKELSFQANRQLFLKNKAKNICAEMDKNNIPMVILKNGGIMMSMIDEPVKCPMEDIDSLIRKEDFFKADEILKRNGFKFRFRSQYENDEIEEAFRHGSAEYYIDIPDGDRMWFELSWRAIDGRWIRPDLEPDTNSLIDRSFIAKNTKVHVLSKEDNLLQVCIHTAKHSFCRAPGLRLHMDVDRIVSHNDIDWIRFLRMVREAHVCNSTYLSLYIPSVLFDTNVPEWVLGELKTTKVDKLIRMLERAELIHPKQKKFSKFKFLFFQSALYDKKVDIIHAIYPNKQWIKDRYGCSNNFQIFLSTLSRCLDLIGIRKKKR